MFDSPFCPREFTKFPLIVSWREFLSFMPLVVLVLIVVSLALAIYTKRSPYRQSSTRNSLMHSPRWRWLLIGLTALSIFVFTVVANALFIPPDTGEVADAIVVLGRGRDSRIERVEIAAQLWRTNRAPMIFVSGRGDATAMIEQLEAIVPSQVIDGENCSLTTQENAIFSAAILEPQRRHNKILLVTDPPHMWRSLFDFRAQGFDVIPHPSSLPDNWSWRRKAFITFRECVALLAHGSRGIFARQPKTASPELWNLVEQAQRYGERYLRGER